MAKALKLSSARIYTQTFKSYQAVLFFGEAGSNSQTTAISYKTLSSYLDLYLSAGLEDLVSPIVKPRLQSLNQQKQNKLAQMILHESPQDYLKKGTSGL